MSNALFLPPLWLWFLWSTRAPDNDPKRYDPHCVYGTIPQKGWNLFIQDPLFTALLLEAAKFEESEYPINTRQGRQQPENLGPRLLTAPRFLDPNLINCALQCTGAGEDVFVDRSPYRPALLCEFVLETRDLNVPKIVKRLGNRVRHLPLSSAQAMLR